MPLWHRRSSYRPWLLMRTWRACTRVCACVCACTCVCTHVCVIEPVGACSLCALGSILLHSFQIPSRSPACIDPVPAPSLASAGIVQRSTRTLRVHTHCTHPLPPSLFPSPSHPPTTHPHQSHTLTSTLRRSGWRCSSVSSMHRVAAVAAASGLVPGSRFTAARGGGAQSWSVCRKWRPTLGASGGHTYFLRTLFQAAKSRHLSLANPSATPVRSTCGSMAGRHSQALSLSFRRRKAAPHPSSYACPRT